MPFLTAAALAFLAAFSAAFRSVDFLGTIIFLTLTGFVEAGAGGGGGAGAGAFFFFLGLGNPVILRFRFRLEVLEATEAVSNAELHSELESSWGMGIFLAFLTGAFGLFFFSVECVKSRLKIVEDGSLEDTGVETASLSEAATDSTIL